MMFDTNHYLIGYDNFNYLKVYGEGALDGREPLYVFSSVIPAQANSVAINRPRSTWR